MNQMAITRIERVLYGGDELHVCAQFFADAGLTRVEDGRSVAVFRTLINHFIELRKADDRTLPPGIGTNPEVREMIWGVDTERGLQTIARELSRDRAVSAEASGVLHSRDETGYAVGFKLTDPQQPVREVNGSGRLKRINREKQAYGSANPISLMHIALDIPAKRHKEAN